MQSICILCVPAGVCKPPSRIASRMPTRRQATGRLTCQGPSSRPSPGPTAGRHFRHSRRRPRKQIEAGEYAGREDLAKALKLDRSCVGKMLCPTSLAPDIVEAIVRGEEPDRISLRQLHDGMPLCWQERRERRSSMGLLAETSG